MAIVCDTQINEIMHDRVIFLHVIIIIQLMPLNSLYQ